MFTAAEDVPNGPRVVVIGNELWRRRYGGNPGVIGQTILIEAEPWQVIGVLPPRFRLPLEFQALAPAELVQPIQFDPANTDNSHGYYGVARLVAGVSVAQASAAIAGLATRWTAAGQYPVSMHFSAFAVGLVEEVTGGVRRAILVLSGSVALLLLIAAANIANLLLVRADSRAREVAVRSALGASRADLLRSALTESVALAVLGGAVGAALAGLGVKALQVWAPTSLPRISELSVDWVVLAFALVTSIMTGILVGVAPALRTSDVDLASALKEGGRGGSEGPGRGRVREGLISFEIAMAVTLVIGASLTFRSFANLIGIDPGFKTNNVLTLNLALNPVDYPKTDDLIRFFAETADEVKRLPGVVSAGFVRVLPIASEIGDAGMEIEARPVGPGEPSLSADWQVTTPGYFETMGIRLVSGRFLDSTDTRSSRPVIAINETLAREYFRGEPPVGKRIRVGDGQRPWREIVGVVGDTRHNGLTNPYKRAWFIPHSQFAEAFGETRRSMTLVVRTTGDAESMLLPIRALMARRDKNIPLTEVATLSQVIGGALQGQRFVATLMGGLALLTLLLAAIGIDGVVSYSVAQRTREIGVRLALGADGSRVRTMVVRQSLRPVGLGLGVGLLLAAALSQTLKTILYGVAPLDPVTFGAVPIGLLVVAIGAALGPAARATRIAPIEALRPE